MATAAQVRKRAGNDLGILPLGRNLRAEDDIRIGAAYNEVYAQLKRDGLATWASDGEVPDEVVPHLAALIALQSTLTYKIPEERYQRVLQAAGFNGETAKREIRKLVQPSYIGDEPVDY